jgi:hypothetical protein
MSLYSHASNSHRKRSVPLLVEQPSSYLYMKWLAWSICLTIRNTILILRMTFIVKTSTLRAFSALPMINQCRDKKDKVPPLIEWSWPSSRTTTSYARVVSPPSCPFQKMHGHVLFMHKNILLGSLLPGTQKTHGHHFLFSLSLYCVN